jgi:ABC-type branched-subunit amino acid transport system ATPase component
MRFGGIQALLGVSLVLGEGSIVGLIGPNGSGKTTLLNCISGIFRPTSGSVTVDGRQIHGRPGNQIARLGIVRTFQNIRLFSGLTSLQNVEVSALASGGARRANSAAVARRLLEELGIADAADRDASTLSYGDQRRLEIARALAARPRFLLLDEPAAGMNEVESERLRKELEHIRAERGCGVLVIDHDLHLIMQLCEHIYVLAEGRVICDGTPRKVRADPAVIAAYIGEVQAETVDQRVKSP